MTLHIPNTLFRALLLALAAAGGSAFGQGGDPWPSRPLRVVVPYVAGAMGDVVTRRLADGLRIELGQSIVVDNRPGAGGNIGTRAVEQSPADGYTVLVAATNNFTINQFLYKDLGFDPLKRLDPITVLVDVPSVLFVPAGVPAQNFREFVTYAKANPGRVNYGSPGSGTTPHLSAETINKAHALGMTHVPYKGASQVVTALLGGEVQFYLAGAGVGAAHVKAGKLRALAVAAKTRLEALPEVPTFVEAGLGAINASNWWGVAVPAGTPKTVVDRLHAALCKALGEPQTRAAMIQMGNVPVCNAPAEMRRQLADEAAMWQRTLPTLGVQVD